MQTTISDNLRQDKRAWVDSINNRSEDSFLDLHSTAIVLYDPTLGSLNGKPALSKMWTGLINMFPDYHVRKIRSFGQEDWVCLEVEESGTMKGPIHAGPKEFLPLERASGYQARSYAESTTGKLEKFGSISTF